MAYSHSRLRKTLALIRIFVGAIFVLVGMYKITSLEFATVRFPVFLAEGIQGAAAEWIRPVLQWIVAIGAGRTAVMIGFVELFIGISLFLGLAVRPAALVGMLYSVGLFLATWNQGSTTASMLQSAEHQFRNLFPFFVFLVIGVGHAGETWGVGAVYHRHRTRRWDRESASRTEEARAPVEEEARMESFEEFLEREERSMAEGDDSWKQPEHPKEWES